MMFLPFQSSAPSQSANKLLRGLIGFEILLVSLYWLDILLGQPFPLLHGLFDLDGEANLPTWFSSAQLLLIGSTLLLVALCRPSSGRPSRSFLLLAGSGFVLLSVDEVVQLHEGITGLLGSRYIDWAPRLVSSHIEIALVILALASIATLKFYPDLRAIWMWSRRASLLAIAGICLVILGGSVLESVAYRFLESGSLVYKLEVTVEEFLEMFGASLILHSVTCLAFATAESRSAEVRAVDLIEARMHR